MKEGFDKKTIKKRLESIEQRLLDLERKQFPSLDSVEVGRGTTEKKQITLAELRKQAEIKNGQESVALIIGFYEKVLNLGAIPPKEIENGWRDGKFDGKYNPIFLRRAIKDGLVRSQKSGLYDLSGSGEDFFNTRYKK